MSDDVLDRREDRRRAWGEDGKNDFLTVSPRPRVKADDLSRRLS